MFICMYDWRSHLYYDAKKIWKYFMLGWALATFVKGVKIRLRENWLSVLADQKVPQRRNCRWSDEFMINYDGYGLCCVWHGLCNQKLWISEHAVYIFNHKWIVEVLLALPGVVLVMVSVLLGVIGEVMVHVVGYGGVECGWVGWGQEVGHVIHGTNPYPS